MEEIKSINYIEVIPLTYWATIIIGLFITVLTPTILLEVLAVYKDPRSIWLYIILDLFFIIILLNFRKLTIVIDDEYLIASFGLIKKQIKLSEIRDYELIKATLSVYTGMGIRYGRDGSLAYLPTLGDAIKIYYGDKRPFVFSTKKHEQVLYILEKFCRKSGM